MVDRLESLFHPEMRHQLSRWDDPSMCNLETGFPGHQLDFCPPDRADQHETFLRTREAHATAEAEEPCVTNDGTSLLQDLSTKRLFPRLITLGTAPWPPPSLTITADQHHAIAGSYAECIRSVDLARRRRDRRVPSDQPIPSIGTNGKIFAVARDTTLTHRFSLRSVRRATSPARRVESPLDNFGARAIASASDNHWFHSVRLPSVRSNITADRTPCSDHESVDAWRNHRVDLRRATRLSFQPSAGFTVAQLGPPSFPVP